MGADDVTSPASTGDGAEVALNSTMLKALAHPVRRRIISVMADDSHARATDLAQTLDLPVNQVSFHLRSLAKAGFIQEAPEHARDRRDRVWRTVPRSYRLTSGEEPISSEDAAVLAAFLGQEALQQQDLVRRVLHWANDFAAGRDRDHKADILLGTLHLTDGEMDELKEAIASAIASHTAQARDTPPRSEEPDRRRMRWDFAFYAAREDL